MCSHFERDELDALDLSIYLSDSRAFSRRFCPKQLTHTMHTMQDAVRNRRCAEGHLDTLLGGAGDQPGNPLYLLRYCRSPWPQHVFTWPSKSVYVVHENTHYSPTSVEIWCHSSYWIWPQTAAYHGPSVLPLQYKGCSLRVSIDCAIFWPI